MANYSILYSDPAKANNPIVVTDGTVNNASTSLTLIGRNYPGYGQAIATDLVHILENFASSSPPNNPIEGQLWMDTSDPNNKKLKVNDGTAYGAVWAPVNGVHQQPFTPTNPRVGDIWVDTSQQQVNIWNGNSWILIGPNYAGTSKTGSYAQTLNDIYGQAHNVIQQYVAGVVVEIISKDAFVPSPVITGFEAGLKPGVNISAKLTNAIFNGNAANSLQLGGINAINFVRNDIAQSVSQPFQVANDAGLKIGSDPTFILQRNSQYDATFLNTYRVNGARFTFKTSDASGTSQRLLVLDSFNNNGTANPQVTVGESGKTVVDFNVNGSVSAVNTGTFKHLVVTSNDDFDATSPALSVAGGAYIGLRLETKGEHILEGPLTIGTGTVTLSSLASANSVVIPANGNLNIGDQNAKWNNVYANTFYGQFSGNLSGTASRIPGSTLNFQGMVTAPGVLVDGSSPSYVFTTTLTVQAIYGQTASATTNKTDSILVYQPSALPDLVGNGALVKQAKSDFLSDLYKTSLFTGVIVPYAGVQGDGSPVDLTGQGGGWLLCDGSAHNASDYPGLAAILTVNNPAASADGGVYRFGGSGNQFKVPNLSNELGSGLVYINYYIKT